MLVALIASAALLAGCWPARFVEQPEVRGTVLSAQTHEPIAGARVALASTFQPERTSVVTTDANGNFEIRAVHDWKLYSPLGEGWPVPGLIEVSAKGFVPQQQPLAWSMTGRSKINVGTILLLRVK